jgi:hypothetical protein
VDRFGDVADFTPHLDGEHRFGDEFASSGANDTAS